MPGPIRGPNSANPRRLVASHDRACAVSTRVPVYVLRRASDENHLNPRRVIRNAWLQAGEGDHAERFMGWPSQLAPARLRVVRRPGPRRFAGSSSFE